MPRHPRSPKPVTTHAAPPARRTLTLKKDVLKDLALDHRTNAVRGGVSGSKSATTQTQGITQTSC